MPGEQAVDKLRLESVSQWPHFHNPTLATSAVPEMKTVCTVAIDASCVHRRSSLSMLLLLLFQLLSQQDLCYAL